ncbi:MAG TPA: 50S ribosomal protein L4 [Vicinamibacterales bacterium]|jgi:large subunit ribosomal protein L4
MNLDVVNSQNEKVDTLELSDELFGGRIASHLVWESVVHANAAERRGTHKTKTRGAVSGTGKKPWRQKGTGRARVGEARNPLWRKGGTVFGPQPRSYDYRVPRKVERGALRAALAARLADQGLVVVDQLVLETTKTKAAAEMLKRLGVTTKGLIVDMKVDDKLALAIRNIEGVRPVETNRLTARDLADGGRIVMTRAALERLQEVLG